MPSQASRVKAAFNRRDNVIAVELQQEGVMTRYVARLAIRDAAGAFELGLGILVIIGLLFFVVAVAVLSVVAIGTVKTVEFASRRTTGG